MSHAVGVAVWHGPHAAQLLRVCSLETAACESLLYSIVEDSRSLVKQEIQGFQDPARPEGPERLCAVAGVVVHPRAYVRVRARALEHGADALSKSFYLFSTTG